MAGARSIFQVEKRVQDTWKPFEVGGRCCLGYAATVLQSRQGRSTMKIEMWVLEARYMKASCIIGSRLKEVMKRELWSVSATQAIIRYPVLLPQNRQKVGVEL
jgi:hypothetical protein